MIDREAKHTLDLLLNANPAVILFGPRQIGKTTLALEIARERDAVYLDLQRPSDLAKISDVEQFCETDADRLLILDEVHHVPELFTSLRGIIDQRRRAGNRTEQFLLLGSASIDLMKQSSETLAGRIAHCELHPVNATELESSDMRRLWLRGGFPESYLAESDEDSLDWRLALIRTYLERDVPQLGPRIPAETLRRFWTMLAHNQGQTFNASALARGLDVSGVTIHRYLDLLVDLLLVRPLAAWTSNLRRRLVKAPKTYIRDSGLCHALLDIETTNDLYGHPVVGGSWEGFVVENIASAMPRSVSLGYYRTSGGAEIDLIVDLGAQGLWAIEIKRSSAPKVSRGFHSACEDLQPTARFVVHGGNDSFPIAKDVEALTLSAMTERLATLRGPRRERSNTSTI